MVWELPPPSKRGMGTEVGIARNTEVFPGQNPDKNPGKGTEVGIARNTEVFPRQTPNKNQQTRSFKFENLEF